MHRRSGKEGIRRHLGVGFEALSCVGHLECVALSSTTRQLQFEGAEQGSVREK